MLDGNKNSDLNYSSNESSQGAVKKTTSKKEEEISIEDIPF